MSIEYRVTERSIASRALAGLQGNLAKVGTLQEQLSSGKLISKPSDSPTGTVQAMQYRGEVRSQQQYSRNADDGLGWLSTLDNTLTGSLNQIQRVRDLTVQGISTGSNDPGTNEAMATEIDNIRQSLLDSANTTYLGRPVFGGTTSGSKAYDTTGAYTGDSGTVNRTVGDGIKVRVDATGPEVFGTGSSSLFSVLGNISNDLRTNPSALSGDLSQLDGATANLQAHLSDIGARYNRMTTMKQSADDRVNNLKTQLSDIEDIDLPKTITDLQLQQTAYQAALAATAKVVQPSLLDFLK